jgi:hypothetical protein
MTTKTRGSPSFARPCFALDETLEAQPTASFGKRRAGPVIRLEAAPVHPPQDRYQCGIFAFRRVAKQLDESTKEGKTPSEPGVVKTVDAAKININTPLRPTDRPHLFV